MSLLKKECINVIRIKLSERAKFNFMVTAQMDRVSLEGRCVWNNQSQMMLSDSFRL